MDEALLAARLVLAAVFTVAGVTKLADPGGTRAAAVEFGAPVAVAPAVAVVLPVTELATAALLVPAATAQAGATLALGLLLAVSAAVAAAAARGRTPDCRCFGNLRPRPAGPATLGRNFALALLAGFVVVAEG